MPDIGNYTETIITVLGEAGKYFVVLLLAVLAVRLGRRWRRSTGPNRRVNLILTLAATALAVTAGWVSMGQSMSKLYAYYGRVAFQAGRVQPAEVLFETSSHYWKTADALGSQGVCLLLLGHRDAGLQMIDQARQMRGGISSPMEAYYEGLYYFGQADHDRAVPLLETASGDETYRWNVVKILAVMALDQTNAAEASRLMQPYTNAEVAEFDQAYIMAELKLAGGQRDEARTLFAKFAPPDGSVVWKTRFEKLGDEINH